MRRVMHIGLKFPCPREWSGESIPSTFEDARTFWEGLGARVQIIRHEGRVDRAGPGPRIVIMNAAGEFLISYTPTYP